MKRDVRAWLWDVLDAGTAIEQFTEGHTITSYGQDPVLQAAVERKFGVIGEALNRLSKTDPDLAARIPDLPRIIGFRNVLIHGYAVVDPTMVWHAREALLPRLIDRVRTLLDDLGPP